MQTFYYIEMFLTFVSSKMYNIYGYKLELISFSNSNCQRIYLVTTF